MFDSNLLLAFIILTMMGAKREGEGHRVGVGVQESLFTLLNSCCASTVVSMTNIEVMLVRCRNVDVSVAHSSQSSYALGSSVAVSVMFCYQSTQVYPFRQDAIECLGYLLVPGENQAPAIWLAKLPAMCLR